MRHGPQRLEGPLRGTPAWWRAQGPEPGADPSAAGNPPNPAEEGTIRHEPMEGIRWDLVERVRGDIAAGAYDTPQRWEAALDRLLDRLESDV